jgi:hypothetical protein
MSAQRSLPRAKARVVSVSEYRDCANECMDWAKTAKSDRERAIFLQIAQTWLHATTPREGKEHPPERLPLYDEVKVAAGGRAVRSEMRAGASSVCDISEP